MDIITLPFNKLVGLAVAQQKDGIFSLPAEVRYTNHLGTVHAGALLTLAESTSGEYLLREFGGLELDVIPVVRRLEAKFRKPAYGAVYSKVSRGVDNKDKVIADLTEKGRASVEVQVNLYDEKDAHVMTASVEWFISTTSQRPRE